MGNIENIVVGLDISKNIVDILKRAFSVAKQDNSKLTLVHTIENSIYEGFLSNVNMDKMKEDVTSNIEQNLSNIDTLDIQYSIVVDEGTASNLIVNTAKDLNADLIIIGENSEENFKTTVFGATAHNVAQKSNLPLLIIKNTYQRNYSNMVAFSDLSKVSLESVKFANSLFKNDDIKVVSVYKQIGEIELRFHNNYDQKEDIQAEIRKNKENEFQTFTKENNIHNSELIEDLNTTKSVLLNYVKTNKNDLVILGSKGVHNTHSLLYGSTTSFLMENVDSDILIYIPKL